MGRHFWLHRKMGDLETTWNGPLESRAGFLLQWGQANCWMDGQGAGLPYPWVCWGALVFSVLFALPQHIALLIWDHTREQHAKWLQQENTSCSQNQAWGGTLLFFFCTGCLFFFFSPEKVFQKKPYRREWCFLSSSVGLACCMALGEESVGSKQLLLTNLSFRRRCALLRSWHPSWALPWIW